MTTPLISIIVPIYNVGDYLEKCVNSIVFQSYRNIEVLLIDDGSTDNSGTLCDILAKKFKRVYSYHKENGGLSSARNYGLDRMKGEYFFFVDSDDYLLPGAIETMYYGLKLLNVDVIECQYIKVSGNEGNSSLNNVTLRKDSIQKFLSSLIAWKDHYPMAWNKLYSTKKFGKYRFKEDRLNEDEFYINDWITDVNEVGYVSNNLYCYRERPGSIMAKPYSIKRTDTIVAYVKRLDIIKQNWRELLDPMCEQLKTQVLSKTKLVASQGNDNDLAIRKKIAELVTPVLDDLLYCPKISNKDKTILSLIQTDFDKFIAEVK